MTVNKKQKLTILVFAIAVGLALFFLVPVVPVQTVACGGGTLWESISYRLWRVGFHFYAGNYCL